MGETLFLAHRVPFPPDRGDKIRSHHLLRALAETGPVHVGTLGETEADFAAEPMLRDVAATYCLAHRPRSLALAGLNALAKGVPVSLAAFASVHLHHWIQHTLATRPIETIFVFSGQMGQYVPADYAGRLVVDLCDVDSAKFEAYARDRGMPQRWINAREARLLAREEARLAGAADATLLVSEQEAQLFRERIGSVQANVLALGNGIDTTAFDPAIIEPHPELASNRGPHIVFTGQMDYAPNVEAVIRAVRRLMPGIRQTHPDARFHIVGRAPAREVTALDGHHGARVWGEVPGVRPFLAAADLVLVPLTIARGVQNKVLEAMAMARPVLLTPQAAAGIGSGEQQCAVESSDADLITAAIALLSDGPSALAMGAAARRFVVEHKSWDAALAPLAAIVGRPPCEARDAA